MTYPCPECRIEVSQHAAACPHCGCPLERGFFGVPQVRRAPATPEEANARTSCQSCVWAIIILSALCFVITRL
jgi:hypothetical protein